MRSSARQLTVVLLMAFALSGLTALPTSAQIAFKPCGDSNDFACGHVTVPLDPKGVMPGTITLAVRRHRAAVGEAHDAIVALAGGPGQPAIPFAASSAETLGPIASTRDLLVFDQRGIGLSQPLACHAFENPSLYHSRGALIAACAKQIGPTRGLYTSAETVADIEAIRVAGGYEKLVLYGTSYGTKVAEEYAQTFPNNVEALVLDSVVPPNGPEPLDRATFEAVPRILRQLCVDRLCAHITREPVADLAKVVQKMRRAPLRGEVLDGHGHPHTVEVASADLLDILVGSDFAPRTRAEVIPYVRAAANGDNAPLARLLVDASNGGRSGSEDSDGPLYYATTCEEQVFPWKRSSSAHMRLLEATKNIRALPASATAPFLPGNMIEFSDVQECAAWPFTTPAPAQEQAALPNVPTLILSGANDLRTPTANAREVAAQIPDAHLLVVPYAGHSVLGGEPTSCASDALKAMFAGHAVKPCPAAPPPPILRPPPLPPLHLADVPSAKGNHGKPGRTLEAVSMTLHDFLRQVELQVAGLESLSGVSSLQSGGLRSGWVQYKAGMYTFHEYSFVPGVTVSGTLTSGGIHLRVGGSAAAHGTLRRGAHDSLVGTLGGHHVHTLPTASTSAAIVGSDARASHQVGPWGSAARAAAGKLAGILRRLLGA
jgi:pimeloyl-ACP methyl ester carboxylesterase